MIFKRNQDNDNETLDYEVPMENEQETPGTYGFNPQAKINAMQKIINTQNETIGSIKGQLAGYKSLRGKYETLLREKIELEYKCKELEIKIEQLNNVLDGQRNKRTEDQEMLGYALKMHPDFLEWYTKEKAKMTVNSYEAQIEILKAKILTLRG
jgi:hypothetical protein